jgi:hypothetical protein
MGDSGSDTATGSSDSGTNSSADEDEWAPGGREYVAHRLRVYGGDTAPWASGLPERASAVHDAALATRELVAAQDAMARAYDAFNDALDKHPGLRDGAYRQMMRGMLEDFQRVSVRLKELTARVESDPYHTPPRMSWPDEWHKKSKRWESDNRKGSLRKSRYGIYFAPGPGGVLD